METVPNETPSPVPSCPDCRIEMEKGWMPELRVGGAVIRHPYVGYPGWQFGEPKYNWFGGLSLDSLSNTIPVTAWRCPQCGLLRQYAIKVKKQWRKVD